MKQTNIATKQSVRSIRSRQVEKRCCVNCSNPNCGQCINCRGKKLFGGDGRNHQRCLQRQCLRLNPDAPLLLKHVPSVLETNLGSSSDASDGDNGTRPVLKSRQKRHRCMLCPGCKAEDCGTCAPCRGKRKFGGDGSDHNSCLARLCHVLYPTVTATGRTRARRPQKRVAEMSIASSSQERDQPRPRAKQKDDRDTDGRRMDRVQENGVPVGSCDMENTYFSLTSYLLQDDAPRVEPNPNIANAESITLYGQTIPDKPSPNVCAGCYGTRDSELSDDPVILCDGANCGREYHLACCVPPLSSVPDVEEWLCQDCCADGSTKSLVQYLESADQAKANYFSSSSSSSGRKAEPRSYVEHLLRLDNVRNSLVESELEKSAMIHTLALCDANHSLARTRGGNERRAALPPTDFIGKPIRLLLTNHEDSNYHTGRIVDYREESVRRSHASSSSTTTITPSFEFLVRFPAGVDDRKTSYYYWIVLEEHVVSVGTTMVWARSSRHWKPAILWLRSARALVYMMNMRSPSSSDVDFFKTKHKVCAMARDFGGEIFTELNVRDQCVDLFNLNAIDVHMKASTDNILPFSLAKVEFAEQERIRKWRELRQINPMGPAVYSSRDYLSLPELDPNSSPSRAMDVDSSLQSAISLIPNIRQGVDRSKLLSLLHQRGFDPTKDMAASLSCEILSQYDVRTMEAIRFDGNSTLRKN